jgi:hypothetical protein
MIFLNPKVRDLDVLVSMEAGVFQGLLGTCHGATIDDDKPLARLG